MSDIDYESYTYKADKLIASGWRQWGDLDAWFAPNSGYKVTMDEAWSAWLDMTWVDLMGRNGVEMTFTT